MVAQRLEDVNPRSSRFRGISLFGPHPLAPLRLREEEHKFASF